MSSNSIYSGINGNPFATKIEKGKKKSKD